MSYSTIMSVGPNRQPEVILGLRNSHGSAPVIWDKLCQELYGLRPFEYSIGDTLDKLWPRWRDLSIPEHKRAVLMMTYDLAYIRKEHYARAASDIRKWLADYPVNSEYVNHWPRIAEFYESNPGYDAIAIHQTSVSENPFYGEWDDEKEDYNLIEWGRVYEVYDEIDGIANARPVEG
ncbi:MAG: hypothetical protein KDK05_12105 [Candidatus Competibacteraceae bacterium]|nr:hypothetical protein [Candidatus Competibacteraceae bacterium]